MLANIQEGFQAAFEQAEAWREKALAIKVTSLADKEAMQQAREMRLTLKNIRVEAEKKRKALKEYALVMGRAIDGVNNLLLAAKIEAAKKADAERIAREQAEAAERERLRIENERLRAEAAEREAKAKAEREAREKLERELAAKKAEEEAKAKAEAASARDPAAC